MIFSMLSSTVNGFSFHPAFIVAAIVITAINTVFGISLYFVINHFQQKRFAKKEQPTPSVTYTDNQTIITVPAPKVKQPYPILWTFFSIALAVVVIFAGVKISEFAANPHNTDGILNPMYRSAKEGDINVFSLDGYIYSVEASKDIDELEITFHFYTKSSGEFATVTKKLEHIDKGQTQIVTLYLNDFELEYYFIILGNLTSTHYSYTITGGRVLYFD